MVFKKYNNNIDLEFEFFRELKLNPPKKLTLDNQDEEWTDTFKDVFSISDGFLCEVKEIIDNKVICDNISFKRYGDYSKYVSFENTFNLKIGEVILIETSETSNISDDEEKVIKVWIIKDNIMNVEVLQELKNKMKKPLNQYYYTTSISTEDIENKTFLSKSNIKRAIKKKTAQLLKQKKKDEKKEKTEQKIKEVEQKKRNIDFKKKGKCKIDNFDIDGKELIKGFNYGNPDKFILKKNVNKIFDYSFFERSYSVPQDFLIQQQQDFTKQTKNQETGEWETEFKISFKKDNKKQIIKSLENKKYNPTIRINRMKVRKDKVDFILRRISKDTTNEEIKLLNTLTGMKADIIGLETIKCNDNRFDIKISIRNQDSFKVEFINKTKNFNWNLIKKYFFDGGSSRSCSNYFGKTQILNFTTELGIPKQEFYNHLQKVVLLKELETNNKK